MNRQLEDDSNKISQIEDQYNVNISSSPINAANLAGRASQIMYSKASNEELLEYKKLLDQELYSRSVARTLALSSSNKEDFRKKWGERVYNELLKYAIREYFTLNVPWGAKYDKDFRKVLTKYIITLMVSNTEVSRRQYRNIIYEKLQASELEDIVGDSDSCVSKYFEDVANNPHLIKAIQKIQKKEPKGTPGVILVNIRVPLGKKIVVDPNEKDQMPILVDEEASATNVVSYT